MLHHRSVTILYLKVIAFKNNGKSYANIFFIFTNCYKWKSENRDLQFWILGFYPQKGTNKFQNLCYWQIIWLLQDAKEPILHCIYCSFVHQSKPFLLINWAEINLSRLKYYCTLLLFVTIKCCVWMCYCCTLKTRKKCISDGLAHSTRILKGLLLCKYCIYHDLLHCNWRYLGHCFYMHNREFWVLNCDFWVI